MRALVALLMLASPVLARQFARGVPLSPVPLGAWVAKADAIYSARVRDIDAKAGAVSFSVREVLKGKPAPALRHHGASIRYLRSLMVPWARPGRVVVVFREKNSVTVCCGTGWYWASSGGSDPDGTAVFRAARHQPNGSRIFAGSTEDLVAAVRAILAGKETVVPVAAPEATDRERDWANGRRGHVWRMKASLAITDIEETDTPFSRHLVGHGGGDDPAAMLKQLAHADAWLRAEAANRLGEMRHRAAAPALRRALADKDAATALYAADALLRIGPADEAGLGAYRRAIAAGDLRALRAAAELACPALAPALVAGLRAKDPAARAAAAHALGCVEAGEEALARILDADESDEVRIEAAEALMRLPAPSPRTLTALGQALRAIRPGVARAVCRGLDPAAPGTLRALRAAFAEWPPDAPFLSCQLAREAGPAARPLLPSLLLIARDPHRDSYDRRHAVAAMLAIGPASLRPRLDGLLSQLVGMPDSNGAFRPFTLSAEEASRPLPRTVAALAALLDKGPEACRSDALLALESLGPRAQAAAPAIERLLESEDPAFRAFACRVLVAIGRPGKAVASIMRASPEGITGEAVALIGKAGPAAREAIPMLRKLLKAEEPFDRAQPVLALWRIHRPSADGLRAHDPRLPLLDVLAGLLTGDPGEREEAAAVLGEIGPEAASLVPALARGVAVWKERRCRRAALVAIGKMGAAAWRAEPALRKALKDATPELRLAAAEAMEAVRPGNSLSPAAIQEIAEKVPGLAADAAEALGKLGPQAKAALPWLARQARSEQPSFRHTAAAALRRIGR